MDDTYNMPFQQSDEGSHREFLRSLPKVTAAADLEQQIQTAIAQQHLNIAAELSRLPKAQAHTDFESQLFEKIRRHEGSEPEGSKAPTTKRKISPATGLILGLLAIGGATYTGYTIFGNTQETPSAPAVSQPPVLHAPQPPQSDTQAKPEQTQGSVSAPAEKTDQTQTASKTKGAVKKKTEQRVKPRHRRPRATTGTE